MSENPYQPPVEGLPPEHLLHPERGRARAVAGLVLLALATALSLVVVSSMVKSFGLLAETGHADPSELADAIAAVMWFNLLGMLATLAGGVLTAMSVYGAGNRERWFFHAGWILSTLQLATFPLGTPFGILLLFGFLMKRKEFQPGSPGEGRAS